jgi:hypothetical protein
VAILVAHGVAIFAMAWLFVWWAGLAIVVLMISAGLSDLRLKSLLVTVISVTESGYRLFDRGIWKHAELVSAFVTVPLTVLRFKGESGKLHSLTLFTDSLDMEDYRHLRIRLRWQRDKP